MSNRIQLEAPLTKEEIEYELDKLKTTDTQKILMREMGDCLAVALELPKITMRGFYTLAVIEWQQKINMTAADSEKKMDTDTESRIQTAVEILTILKKKMHRIIKVKKKEHLINEAINKALRFYTKKYAARPPDNLES